jgi:hypothetical protein
MTENGQLARPAADEEGFRSASSPDREPVHLAAPLRDAARAAGWLRTRTPPAAPMPPGTALLGVWSAPDLCPVPDQRCAAVVLTGDRKRTAPGLSRVTARSLSCPTWSARPRSRQTQPPATRPASCHPVCTTARWTPATHAAGTTRSAGSTGGGEPTAPLLAELVFFLPGSTSAPDAPGGWHLATAGPNATTLHADLATPRHTVAALVAAVARRNCES